MEFTPRLGDFGGRAGIYSLFYVRSLTNNLFDFTSRLAVQWCQVERLFDQELATSLINFVKLINNFGLHSRFRWFLFDGFVLRFVGFGWHSLSLAWSLVYVKNVNRKNDVVLVLRRVVSRCVSQGYLVCFDLFFGMAAKEPEVQVGPSDKVNFKNSFIDF